MSGSEFKTDSEVKTSSKYDSRTDYKTYRQGDYSKELSSMDSSDVDSMIDNMSYRELRVFKKSLGIKGKGNTKASLKRSIKAHLSKEQTSQQAKTIDTMSLAELRVVGQRYGVKTGGVKKDVLKQRVKRKMGEIEESEEFQNLPDGSITSITHEGEDFAVDLIDKDVEPHKKVEIKEIDDSVFAVNQETMLGEKEVIMVTVRDSDESLKRKLKENEDNVLASQTSDINNNIMTKSKARPEVMSDFEYDLKREFDLINENKRAGNMVRIPDLYYDMKDQYSKEEFQQKLLELEKERVIELQAASDPKLIPESERDIGISHKSRGHLNYVVWRKIDIIPTTKSDIQIEGTSQVTPENFEKMSYSQLKSIVVENNIHVVREQGKRGRISKKELVESILKNSDSVSISEEYLQFSESKKKGKRGKQKVVVEISNETELKNLKGVLLPTNEYPITEPEPEIGVRGKELSTSKKKRKDWKKRKDLWNEYIEKDQFPFLAGFKSDSLDYVDPVHFDTNLEEMEAIAEKPAFLSSAEKGNANNYTTTKGNQIQTRVLEGEFIGVFSQKRSGAIKADPTPTLYKTKEIRTDDDDIGHYIAAINNMYAWDDPYKPYQCVQRQGNWVKQSPDPLKVNRAHVKSMLDSAGFEQGKLTREVIETELGSKNVLTYRDTKGDTKDLSLSEQQLAICYTIIPEEASIVANTPSGIITFTKEDLDEFADIEITTADIDSITFHSIDEEIETRGKKLTSDELLIAAVRKYDMQPHTAQSLAESLYHQGWITYPRTDEITAEVEDVGVELRKPIAEFRGSNEERKILTIVEQGNKAKQQGYNYLINGYWELKIGDDSIAKSQPRRIFFDESKVFSGSEVDLEVKQIGITPEILTNFLVENDIGTKSTRSQLLEELEIAGVVTLQVQEKEKIYLLDQRGLYMATTYEYLKDHPESRVTELGRRVKKAQTINEVKQIWDQYKLPDRIKIQEFIRNQTQTYLDIERDLSLIDDK